MMLITKNHLYKYILLLIAVLIFWAYLIIDNRQWKEYSKNLFYMDTFINIKIYATNENKVKKAFNGVEKIYKQYHQLTDRYTEYPNVKNIHYINNTLAMDTKLKIDKELYDVIKYGIESYDKSNGFFNISLGNAIDVWKKYRDQGTGIPSYSELSNIGSLDINDIKLYDDYTVEKKSGVKIDLGGISKGYTTEIVGNYLESIGLSKYIINAGGNVKVGNHYNKGKYKIGIEEPKKGSNKIYQVVSANNVSVVTSGGYERYYEYNNEIYHHIINPKTLYPPKYFYAVTIITKDSALADILSTTLFLMPLKDGQTFIESLPDVEAIWYDIDGIIHYSKGFDKYE